ncbi:MAG: hypothetical protein AB7E51_02155 [Pseudodesulfovibrio sp.]|uniref:Uncharacterized protein n=1 Tax=Pseudodesulfovibrio indicus TaxID=1716143 RepID=A0A126QQU6_9BACT|nr:hypothetical protein [Pseudodesulfovibrio indicus]AMK12118.1 hypothetical protein AWY79_13860 [Pseudodesulfovibrio indicus]TDT88720.1 hypothetical protein EDC59_105121 [Pseudodesulfovibrio indicus]
MTLEIPYLILAAVIAVIVGAVLIRWQRPVLPTGYVIVTVLGTLFSVYYILHVMVGSGRTGWP